MRMEMQDAKCPAAGLTIPAEIDYYLDELPDTAVNPEKHLIRSIRTTLLLVVVRYYIDRGDAY